MKISYALKEKMNFERYIQNIHSLNLSASCFNTFLNTGAYEDDIVTRRLKEGVILFDEPKQGILVLSTTNNTHDRLTLYLELKRLKVS